MGFLQRYLKYSDICIQCHNNPDADAVASAFGVYRYLTAHGVEARIVYGGEQPIKKGNMKLLLRECGIPITHCHAPSDFDLLLLVDCQYGQSNVERVEAQKIAIIDHHIQVVEDKPDYLIKSRYQSCSTIVYELLLEEGYPVKDDPELTVAFLYGLYTDTASFSDLFCEPDIAMRTALFAQQPLFEQLIKSNMTVAELLVACDAMYNHYFDVDRRFAIVGALKCEQTVLGIIGDFIIQVDSVYLSFAYTEAGAGYQISIRSCHEKLYADKIAAYICNGIGGGGGHAKKAGGTIIRAKMQEKYGGKSVFEVVQMLLCRYIDDHSIVL
jgi:nanoRNase/pAp phosphatase (c-di-AMP/oligoRNAs hydrolase)